tara:strand:- start:315 stop:710 length:396 start_codon:yes stop_codon:yes gene_type:complete
MEKQVEFSEVYKTINAIKEGDSSKKEALEKILKDYEKGDEAESFLHEIGQKFITIGLEQVLTQTNSSDLKSIGKLSNKEWTAIAYKMVDYANENKLAKNLSSKWEKPRREIRKHFLSMARYITEGLIDSLE